jgi:hypothetical protein
MTEHGHGGELVDPHTPIQVFCPFHGNVNTAAARFYPAIGGRPDYVRCYRCKESWDCINLYMKFEGLEFMEALKRLERRFSIRVPKRPDVEGDIPEPKDKSSADYISPARYDIPRMMTILERRLIRTRNSFIMEDYVKCCRVLDNVQWDLDRNTGTVTDGMVVILSKLKDMIDKCSGQADVSSFS